MKINKPYPFYIKTTTKYFQGGVTSPNKVNYNIYWYKKIYNTENKVIYWKDSQGDWIKWYYDINGERIEAENSLGYNIMVFII